MESKSCAISELREHSKDWSKFNEIIKENFIESLFFFIIIFIWLHWILVVVCGI